MTDARASLIEQEQRLLRAMRPRHEDVLQYDGWTVGLAANDAKRSRSVNALGPSILPVDEKIAWCEQRYAERSLPPVFRLTRFSDPEGLDEALAARGYEVFEPSRVLVRAGGPLLPQPNPDLRFESPDLIEWLERTGAISGRPAATRQAIANRLAANPLTSYGLIALRDDQPVAYGLTRLDSAYGWLEDIYVLSEARQAGVGLALCAALIDYGERMGATTTCLTVLANNTLAHRLYSRLDFEFVYDYWYRVRPGDT